MIYCIIERYNDVWDIDVKIYLYDAMMSVKPELAVEVISSQFYNRVTVIRNFEICNTAVVELYLN